MELGSLAGLIKNISKLPGLGPRSARRIVLHLIKNPDTTMMPLIEMLNQVRTEIKICEKCGNVDINSPCHICTNSLRDKHTMCIVEDVGDLWAIERGDFYKGIYHILGGTISALDGRTPEKLNLHSLKDKVEKEKIKEVIIATNATLEGQTTAVYIVDLLKGSNVKFTRIAHGIPMGAELDYMDEGTLTLALKMRQDF